MRTANTHANGHGVADEATHTLTGVDRHGVAYKSSNGKGEEVSATLSADDITQSGQGYVNNSVVQCYENHAQDSRIKPIEVSDTRNQKDGTGGNNLPLVCFSKVSHPKAKDGDGERWDEREVAQTRNTFDNGEKRCQEVVVSTQGLDGYNKTLTGDCAPTISGAACDLHHTHGVISTNSNGEDVAPTISSCEYKMGQKQKDTGGGVLPHPPRGFCLDRFGQYGDREIASAMKQRDYKDHTDLVVHEKEGAEGE